MVIPELLFERFTPGFSVELFWPLAALWSDDPSVQRDGRWARLPDRPRRQQACHELPSPLFHRHIKFKGRGSRASEPGLATLILFSLLCALVIDWTGGHINNPSYHHRWGGYISLLFPLHSWTHEGLLREDRASFKALNLTSYDLSGTTLPGHTFRYTELGISVNFYSLFSVF